MNHYTTGRYEKPSTRRTSFPDYGRITTMEGSKHQNGENAVKLLWTGMNITGMRLFLIVSSAKRS